MRQWILPPLPKRIVCSGGYLLDCHSVALTTASEILGDNTGILHNLDNVVDLAIGIDDLSDNAQDAI
jgi:hypothetical protein